MSAPRRTFTEHLAHLESLRTLEPGERVRVTRSGRTGELVRKISSHSGWLVRWDEPLFGVERGRVATQELEREVT